MRSSVACTMVLTVLVLGGVSPPVFCPQSVLASQVYTAKFPEATKAAETAMATASNASMA